MTTRCSFEEGEETSQVGVHCHAHIALRTIGERHSPPLRESSSRKWGGSNPPSHAPSPCLAAIPPRVPILVGGHQAGCSSTPRPWLSPLFMGCLGEPSKTGSWRTPFLKVSQELSWDDYILHSKDQNINTQVESGLAYSGFSSGFCRASGLGGVFGTGFRLHRSRRTVTSGPFGAEGQHNLSKPGASSLELGPCSLFGIWAPGSWDFPHVTTAAPGHEDPAAQRARGPRLHPMTTHYMPVTAYACRMPLSSELKNPVRPSGDRNGWMCACF